MENQKPQGPDSQDQQPIIGLQRIYLKDLSFEAPSAPEIFRQEWQPQINLDLRSQTKALDEETHEVTLVMTITAKVEEKVIFIVELKQAGIFTIRGFNKDELHHILGVFCPRELYPYARETVTTIVNRGSFPQLLLSPVNFDALYAEHLAKLQGNASGVDVRNGDSGAQTVQ